MPVSRYYWMNPTVWLLVAVKRKSAYFLVTLNLPLHTFKITPTFSSNTAIKHTGEYAKLALTYLYPSGFAYSDMCMQINDIWDVNANSPQICECSEEPEENTSHMFEHAPALSR